MDITFTDLLTTYWAQSVLLLAAIAFLLKRIFDLRTKKIEIKHSLFQQNRNAAIIRFLDTYIELQSLYRKVLSKSFEINNIENSDFRRVVEDKYEQLYASYFYFKFFLDPLEQVRYADLLSEMQNIHAKIVDTSLELNSGDNNLSVPELRTYISDKLKINNDNIKSIGQFFRENTSKHFPIHL